MDETSLAINRISKGDADAAKQCSVMEQAFPESCVTGYESLEACMELPDQKDRHVLAAAIVTSASIIITDNIKDFPCAILNPLSINAISADEFIADTISLETVTAVDALKKMRERLKKPKMDSEALLEKIERHRLSITAEILKEHKLLL